MMKRKEFLKQSLFAFAVMGQYPGWAIKKQGRSGSEFKPYRFKLNYAPKLGMFKEHAGEDLNDQLKFISDIGFRGLTDDGMRKRPVSEQKSIGEALEKLNLRMGVIGAHTYSWDKEHLVTGDKSTVGSFLEEIKSIIEVAKRVNGKWLTVMPGRWDLRMEKGYQTANVIEALKRASELLEPHDLVMVIEPVNRNYPNLFLTTISQAYAVCKAVDSPSCKILNDLYHQQITEGNLISNIDRAWEEIGIFQVGDNPGRNEPYTGEINFKSIFKHIHSKGYEGLIGMEHGKSLPGKEGEVALINAYIKADDFTS